MSESYDLLAEVIGRAQQRDPAAFDELVERFSPRLFGLLYRLSGSHHDAEDLLQEVFLRVVRTIEGYRHRGRFEAWLYRIALNLARDRVRRQQRRGSTAGRTTGSTMDWISLDGRPASQPPPDQPLELAEQVDRLQQALESLLPPEREVIMLRHFSDMSFREIADTMGTPIGTALARSHRGLARLRRLMGTEGQT